jgi:hypothetical protein
VLGVGVGVVGAAVAVGTRGVGVVGLETPATADAFAPVTGGDTVASVTPGGARGFAVAPQPWAVPAPGSVSLWMRAEMPPVGALGVAGAPLPPKRSMSSPDASAAAVPASVF